ncbi:MAG: aldehyde ferredoxin oxidoreductase [Chloroflexi bacterium]|nr:aldehyde ferredoxin oxidoreductase [Chloroflexota bacterium]
MPILRVNVRTRTAQVEPTPPTWQPLGGRGLIARILLDMVPPTADPLGPRNVLIFAPGLLGGHRLSSVDRISVGGKSPLTQGVKEANAGGRTGWAIARLGYKAILFEDQPRDGRWWVVHISRDGVRFDPADDLVGLGTYETAARLRERYGFGPQAALALIGPAGERQMRAAGIAHIDKDGVPSRLAARGGLGAVMGSKGIKAILVDPAGSPAIPLAQPEVFKQARKAYLQALLAHPQTHIYETYGTAAMVNMCNRLGGLPTRNFSQGQFEHAERISGEALRQLILQRNGQGATAHACMAGCSIQCSNIVPDAHGQPLVSPLEYETIALMGSNLGIADLDAIAQLNFYANDLGLDTIDLGAALGVAAEAGLWPFGQANQALALVQQIYDNTPLGRLLGNGAAITGRVLGVRRVPAVKGQAISAYDPRAIKGTGVTYATSPQGADHTAGLTIRAQIDHLDPHVQGPVSRQAQLLMAGYDTLGVCIFAAFGFAKAPETIPALLRGRYGWDVPEDILLRLGRETIRLERAFNRAAGFTPAHDRIPEWMTQEPLPPTNSVFDVPDEVLTTLWQDLD